MENIQPYIEKALEKANGNTINMDLNGIMTSAIQKIGTLLNLPSLKELKNIDWSDISAIVTAIGATLIILFFSFVILYIFKAVGFYKMASNAKKPLAWLSFIPYGFFYVMGKIVGKTRIYGINIDHPEYLLPILLLACMLPIMCPLCLILFVLFFYGLLYRLYQLKIPNFAIVLTILSLLIPPLIPFFIFSIRKK